MGIKHAYRPNALKTLKFRGIKRTPEENYDLYNRTKIDLKLPVKWAVLEPRILQVLIGMMRGPNIA
ncbi:MAG: hypothetical protein DCC75_03940 [Proteobacteria bacterium]|nr:MAG: hypothetical protein DCC75_03940 [Pseudomonadota bacterium]